MLIGVGERKNHIFLYWPLELYLFVGSVQVSGSSDFWHKHLGHLSNLVVRKLLRQFSFKNKWDELCAIGLRAKQTRDVFPLSSNNVVEIFDLIHCDMWGPYNVASTCGIFYFLTIFNDYSRFV